MMKWVRQIGWTVIALVMVAGCSFPPPTTSDDQERPSSSDPSQYTPPPAAKVTTREKLAENSATIKALQEQMDQLKGKLEVLSYENQQQRELAQKASTDFDARLSLLENKPLTQTNSPSTTQLARSIGQSPMVVDSKSVATLINNVKLSRDLDKTIPALESWIGQNPKDKQKVNAQLSLAQAYFNLADYPRAVQSYQTVVDEHPGSDQACKARHHQGLSFLRLGDPKNAKLFFQETIELCPKSAVKKDAESEIKKIS